ncbi:hypothetical protein BDV95DRAFT_573921 [Massariosphaeria phaeospora]|uniref:Uncharacterized protein n=1 Tax=Massariosphaeria phaeospora TaxID=100035 RepID=A0A7C8MAI5_9PLEO|nr:hypothetical protein BDV95DRAFT_573921 [Massariosphaeria phaeospora]
MKRKRHTHMHHPGTQSQYLPKENNQKEKEQIQIIEKHHQTSPVPHTQPAELPTTVLPRHAVHNIHFRASGRQRQKSGRQRQVRRYRKHENQAKQQFHYIYFLPHPPQPFPAAFAAGISPNSTSSNQPAGGVNPPYACERFFLPASAAASRYSCARASARSSCG